MDSGELHRIYIQLKRIANALEQQYPPKPDEGKEPRRGFVL